ncbi:MAG: nuclear transport factor 2 family protein [Parcubacteria group bacterium]
MSPVEIAQAQLDAYNAQDLDAYCGFFTDDVVVADLNGAVTSEGGAAYRDRYENAFAQFPQNKAELLNRIVVGDTVIDHERVSRGPEGPVFEVAAIYSFRDGKISRVDFVK